MKHRHLLLALAIGAGAISLSACKKEPAKQPAASAAPAAAKGETADEFIARVNDEYRKSYPEISSAQWLSSSAARPHRTLRARPCRSTGAGPSHERKPSIRTGDPQWLNHRAKMPW